MDLPGEGNSDIGTLFAEELGLVLEVAPENEQQVVQAYQKAGLATHSIGSVISQPSISIAVDGQQQLAGAFITIVSVTFESFALHAVDEEWRTYAA